MKWKGPIRRWNVGFDWGPLNAQYHHVLYEAQPNQKFDDATPERVSMQANRYVSMHIDHQKSR